MAVVSASGPDHPAGSVAELQRFVQQVLLQVCAASAFDVLVKCILWSPC